MVNLKWNQDRQVLNILEYFQRIKNKSKHHQVVIEADQGVTVAPIKIEREMRLIDQWKRKVIHRIYS